MWILVIQASWNCGYKWDYVNRKDSDFTGTCPCLPNTRGFSHEAPPDVSEPLAGRSCQWPLAWRYWQLTRICLLKYSDTQLKKKIYRSNNDNHKFLSWIHPTSECFDPLPLPSSPEADRDPEQCLILRSSGRQLASPHPGLRSSVQWRVSGACATASLLPHNFLGNKRHLLTHCFGFSSWLHFRVCWFVSVMTLSCLYPALTVLKRGGSLDPSSRSPSCVQGLDTLTWPFLSISASSRLEAWGCRRTSFFLPALHDQGGLHLSLSQSWSLGSEVLSSEVS